MNGPRRRRLLATGVMLAALGSGVIGCRGADTDPSGRVPTPADETTVGASAAPTAGAPPVTAPGDDGAGCTDLTVIGARGSGQRPDEAEPSGFGREAGDLAIAVAAAAAEPPNRWNTAFLGVDYPAVDVPSVRADPTRFDTSVRAGALAAVELARQAVARCPRTRLVFLGSSQGAVVGHGLAALVGSDADLATVRRRVMGIVLLGDPTRRRGDADVEHADIGGLAPTDGFLAEERLDVGPSVAGRVLSVCVSGDTVCSSIPGTTWQTLVITPVHNTAYRSAEVTSAVLAWLGSRPDPS